MSSAGSTGEIDIDFGGTSGLSVSSDLDSRSDDGLELLQGAHDFSVSSGLDRPSDDSIEFLEGKSLSLENQFDHVGEIYGSGTDEFDACHEKGQNNFSVRRATDPGINDRIEFLTLDGGTAGRGDTSRFKICKKIKGLRRKHKPSSTSQAVLFQVINNPRLFLTKKTQLSAPRARNINLGGTQIIHSPHQDMEEATWQKTSCRQSRKSKRDPRVKRLLERTEEDIKRWTRDMIKTSFVDEIVKKVDKGTNWITITGNAGDGKTTTGYMVLEEMVKRGKEVFHVKETDQYHIVMENTKNSVLMLNDVLGPFAFDHTALSKWESVIHDALDIIINFTETGRSSNMTVIFISRLNVLQGARNMLGKYAKYIFDKESFISLGIVHENTKTERLKMVEYHLQRMKICDISESEKNSIASCVTPHGFPHCCKMYAEMRRKSEKVNIKEFFTSPIHFLDDTTRVLIEKDENGMIFKSMLEKDGKLDVDSFECGDFRQRISPAVSSLAGSYLTDNNGIITFSHPSIRESVAHCIARQDVLFAVENFNISFLIQKVRFADTFTNEAGELSSDLIYIRPTQLNIERLYERFCLPIFYRNFEVLQHNFFLNYDFCEKVISSVIFHGGTRIFCCGSSHQDQTDKLPIDERNENGFTLLHMAGRYGNNVAIKVLLKHGANVDVLTDRKTYKRTCLQIICSRTDVDVEILMTLISHGADVNKAQSTGVTPLHDLCQSEIVNGRAIALMLQHGACVNKEDMYGCTPLHYLYRTGKAEDTIDLMISHGADINKVDEGGLTPLHYLCQNDNVDGGTIDLMISKGAEVNRTDNSGRTPLHYLCANEKVEGGMINLMISCEADINMLDSKGRTPLHCLCRNEKASESTVDLMISCGADANKADRKGLTSLQYLCQRQ